MKTFPPLEHWMQINTSSFEQEQPDLGRPVDEFSRIAMDCHLQKTSHHNLSRNELQIQSYVLIQDRCHLKTLSDFQISQEAVFSCYSELTQSLKYLKQKQKHCLELLLYRAVSLWFRTLDLSLNCNQRVVFQQFLYAVLETIIVWRLHCYHASQCRIK